MDQAVQEILDTVDWDNVAEMQEEISKFVFTSKYARYREDLKRRETWEEAVERVESMHLRKFAHLSEENIEGIRRAFDFVREKKAGPSMRSMQFGGIAVEKSNARLYNCSVRHVDSIRSFAEIFYMLLNGSGVGIGLSKKYLDRLPDLIDEERRQGIIQTYVVEDTIEGWADSLEALMSAYFVNTPYSGRTVVFDYSRIRPEGSPLKTSGGKAPGYVGLKAAHQKIKHLLDALVEVKRYKRMRSIDAYDILMHTADAVLSGGVRRSATSVVFQKDDREMINAKTGDWFNENPQRARSNNSVILDRKTTTFEEFIDIYNRTKEWGEPGFVWADNAEDTLYNPCFTMDTRIMTDGGWRRFSELIGTSPIIMQDPRIKGELVNGEEVWSMTGAKGGSTVPIQAFNVRKTGEQEVIYKLSTSNGRVVRATGNHHFATNDGMIELSRLSVGDKIMVGVSEPHVVASQIESDAGFLAGLAFGDGNMSGGNVNIDIWSAPGKEEDHKTVQEMAHNVIAHFGAENRKGGQELRLSPRFLEANEHGMRRMSSAALGQVFASFGFTSKKGLDWLHQQSKDFKAGFVSGLFYADGHIEGNNKSKTVSLRITQTAGKALQDIQLILQELGVISRIYPLLDEKETLLPNSQRESAPYLTKATERLSVSGKESIARIKNFLTLSNQDALTLDAFVDKIYGGTLDFEAKHAARYWDKVASIEMDGIEDVYCLQEDENRTLIAEGLVARRCFEISFIPVTEAGVAGVQVCNLSTVNAAKVNTEQDFYDAIEAATIIGTLQASYTDFPYLSSAAEELTREEALLGVSITGMFESPDIVLDAKLQRKATAHAVEVNRKWAQILGINQAARVTAIKPEGTSSLVFGTMASGIHPAHSPYMFRRIQMNRLDNVYRHFRAYNPHLCEESVWSANKTDDVVTFPVKVKDGAKFKGDVTALEHLEIIKSTQQNYILPGITEANRKPISHNVSSTVVVKPEEWDDVAEYIFDNREYFTAVSLLGDSGDKDYAQAPNEAIVTVEDAEKFKSLITDVIPVDYSWMEEEDDNTAHQNEAACVGSSCEVTVM